MNGYLFKDGYFLKVEKGIENKELTKLVRKHGSCEIYALNFFDGECFSVPKKSKLVA